MTCDAALPVLRRLCRNLVLAWLLVSALQAGWLVRQLWQVQEGVDVVQRLDRERLAVVAEYLRFRERLSGTGTEAASTIPGFLAEPEGLESGLPARWQSVQSRYREAYADRVRRIDTGNLTALEQAGRDYQDLLAQAADMLARRQARQLALTGGLEAVFVLIQLALIPLIWLHGLRPMLAVLGDSLSAAREELSRHAENERQLSAHLGEQRRSRRAMLSVLQDHELERTRVQRTEQRLRRIIESSGNGLLVVDERGVITLANSRAERMFGYAPGTLADRPVEILLPSSLRPGHDALRAQFMEDPSERAMGAGRDLAAVREDGSEFPVEIGLNPIVTDEGIQVIASIVDISERKAIEFRLRQQAEQLAEANRYKSEFLANMSHELRTPLNSILLLSGQLCANRNGNLAAKEVEYAGIIQRCGTDLLTLINDILDLSKIDAGRMPVNLAEIPLDKYLRHVQETFAPNAELKGLYLELDIEPGCPALIYQDPTRLDQIMKNLLSNAVKFTSQGLIRIRAGALASETGATAFFIAVQDTGVGIPGDAHELVFEAFRQLDGSTRRAYGGTGLGLAISKRLANLLGGDIRLVSEAGKGSEFILELPIRGRTDAATFTTEDAALEAGPSARDDAPSLPAPPPEPGEMMNLAGARVLVVDDDVRNLYVMSGLLEEHALDVLTATGGQEALALVAESGPVDLILMDMMMPDVDGFQALQRLRAADNPVPVVAVTALAMPGDRERCLAAGADDYLAKPVAAAELLATVNRWLRTEAA